MTMTKFRAAVALATLGTHSQLVWATLERRNQVVGEDCVPEDFVPREDLKAYLTGTGDNDCVYYINGENVFFPQGMNDMDCVFDEEEESTSKGKGKSGKGKSGTTTRGDDDRLLRMNRGSKGKSSSEMFSGTATCNFNLRDDTTIGLLLDPVQDNECVSATTIQAVCYNSVPDLRMLCPRSDVTFAGPGLTIDPISTSLPVVEDFGTAATQNLASIVPTGATAMGGTSYNITLGCAEEECYTSAITTCLPDAVLVTGPSNQFCGGTAAVGFRIRGCSSGDELYVGAPVDNPANRNEAGFGGGCNNGQNPGSFAGTQNLQFNFQNVNGFLTAEVMGVPGVGTVTQTFDSTAVAQPCPDSDYVVLEVQISDRRPDSAVSISNVELNGNPVPQVDFSSGYEENSGLTYFCISQVAGDFSNFQLTGDLTTVDWRRSENMRLEVVVRCPVM